MIAGMARVKLSKAIIKQILLRLPVKSLLRFESASKEWSSLISSYEFVKEHLKISSNNNRYIKIMYGSKTIASDLDTCSIQSIIDGDRVSDPVPFTYRSAEPNPTFTFLGSCNGLVSVHVRPDERIVVWNPTTRKSKWFRRQRNKVSRSRFLSWGFGYDQLHNAYKVVQLFDDTHLQVYSLRTNSWKTTLSKSTSRLMTINEENGKFVHGTIHWTGYSRGRAVCSFDLATETFALSRMPDIEAHDYYDLEVLGGCLAISSRYSVYMDVWLMMEFGKSESWTRVLRIPFSSVSILYNSSYDRPRPLFLLGKNRIILKYGTSLRICDSSKPQPQRVGSDHVFNDITYVESLVSPNMRAG